MGDVIKSFLVGLGFEVDESSLKKFNKSIESASVKVLALYGSVKIMSAAVVYGISKISEGFEQMGYEYRIIAPAINKALMLRRELLKAYSAAGINITKVIQSSVKLNFSLAKTKFAFEAIYKSVASRFFDTLTKSSDTFRKKIYQNMPAIQNALERMVKFIFKALEATTTLGVRLWSILTRVYDFFVKLDKATDGWSTIIMGVIAAWKLLNLSFLATPLGMLLAGFVALLALWDDLQTFKEGGKSLFNWGPVIPFLDEVGKVLSNVLDYAISLVGVVKNLIQAFWKLAHLDFSGFWDSIKKAGEGALAVFTKLFEIIKGYYGLIGSVASSLGGFLADKLDLNATVTPSAPPLGAGGNSSLSNQNVNQQTNINIMGGVDAQGTGNAVASSQNAVNRDMVRNLKGATR